MYKLSLQTGAAGTRPVLKGTEPDIPFIRFKNYLKAAPVSSDSAYIIGAPLDDVRYLYGVLPANREAYVLKGDIPDPALYLARYLTDQLQQKGIRVDGSPFLLPYRGGGKTGGKKGREKKRLSRPIRPRCGR